MVQTNFKSVSQKALTCSLAVALAVCPLIQVTQAWAAPAASSARSVLADAVEPFMEQMLKSLVFSSDFYPYYVLNTTGHVTTDKKITNPMAKFFGE